LSKENFKEKEKLVTGPDGCLTPVQTGRLTVGLKITFTLTSAQDASWSSSAGMTRVRFPAVQDFSLFHIIKNGSAARPVPYPM
jgi:hypothetical protein